MTGARKRGRPFVSDHPESIAISVTLAVPDYSALVRLSSVERVNVQAIIRRAVGVYLRADNPPRPRVSPTRRRIVVRASRGGL